MRAAYLLAVLLLALQAAPTQAAPFAEWLVPATLSAAPELKLRDWQGQSRELGDFRGRVVLVNFWASWCEPCRDEMPELEELRQQYGERGFEVVAVNLAESERRIQSFVRGYLPDGMSFVILQDRNSLAYKQWQVRALPASFLIDRQGQVRWQALGPIEANDAETRSRIEELLGR